MKRIVHKLKSGRGASMIFALLVFLLCVLAGTVALTAASSNVGRYTHLEDEQRQYFSAASALKLIQGKLKETTVTAKIQTQEIQSWWYKDANAGTPGAEPNLVYDSSTQYGLLAFDHSASEMSYFENLLIDRYMPEDYKTAWNAMNIFAYTPGSFEKSYTVTLDTAGHPELENLIYPVDMLVKTGIDDELFDLTVYLSTKDGDAYPLKVVWPAHIDVSTTAEVTTSESPDHTYGMRETLTTITITLTWSDEDRQITYEKAP